MVSKPTYQELENQITELKKQNEVFRLHYSPHEEGRVDYYNTILNNMGDPVFVKDNKSRLLIVNDAFCEIFNLSRDNIIGKTLAEKVPHDERESFLRIDRQVLEDGVENINEESLTVNGLQTRTISTRKTRFFDSDGNKFLIGVIRDITESKQTEEKLRHSEALHKEAQRVAHIGHWELDPDVGTPIWSDEIFRIFGLEPGKSKPSFTDHDTIVHPDDFPILDAAVRSAARDGIPFDLIFRILKPDDKIGWMHAIGTIAFDQNNNINKVFGTAHDITEHKQAEEELKQTQLLLKSSLESPKDIIILSLDRNYRYLYFNKAHKEVMKYAYNKNVEIGMNSLDCITSVEDRNKAKSNYDRSMSGESHSTIQEYGDENISYYESFYNPIYNEKNEIIGITTFARDITKRKHAEIELNTAKEKAEESENKIKTFYTNVQLGIFIVDVNENHNYVFNSINPFSERITGLKNKEIQNKPISILEEKFGTDVYNYVKDLYDKIVRSKKAFTFEEVVELPEKRINLNTTIKPLINNKGRVYQLIGTNIDITRLKKVEDELIIAKDKAEESDRLKSAFLSNMSHEIRTPMNGILGFSNLLKEPNLSSDDQHRFINIIGNSGERMLNTINNIIDISKIESGLVQTNIEGANINEKMEFVYNFLKPEAENKGLKLLYRNTLSSKDTFIKTDSEKIYGTLTNLVKNAIKFTDTGSIEFGYQKKGKYLEFFVKDTGIGIPKNRLDAIFKRFIQADIEDKRAFQGSGLGLSISKSYVKMLGGKIWVESEEGIGSTFYFTIPYKPVSEDEIEIESTASSELNVVQLKNLKILVVEDDEISDSYLSEVLQIISREILHTVTGVEAIETCKNNPDLNLVLMDIRMPVMDGYEATRQIREFNKDVIIIAQTAYGLSGDNEKALDAGCDAYISKPIIKDELMSLIQQYVIK